jgi:tetratricopeptide (TPR) repeat protein
MARLVERLGLTRYDADQYYKEALLAYKKNNIEEAYAQIKLAIQLLPSHAEYYASQGFFYLEDDVQTKAEEAFDKALSFNPYEMLANYGRGMIAYNDKNWEEAVTYFLDALAAQPTRPETQYYLAMVNHRLRNNTHALQWMQEAKNGFAKIGDKRERTCDRWVREFEKLVEESLLRVNPHNPNAPQLNS